MNQEIFVYIIVIAIIGLCGYIYFERSDFQLKCVVSTVDGNKYCVREREKLELAADLLATVTARCKETVVYLNEKHPEDERVKRLVKGFNPKRICETLPTSTLTAYSENKGEKIAFCLNTTKEGNKLIDIETLTFVALHELSHVMTLSVGHKQEFWENFKFLLEGAIEIGIYVPEDYKEKPREYCSMMIKDNPYYDV